MNVMMLTPRLGKAGLLDSISEWVDLDSDCAKLHIYSFMFTYRVTMVV